MIAKMTVEEKLDQFVFSLEGSNGETLDSQTFDFLIHSKSQALLHPSFPLSFVNHKVLLVDSGEKVLLTSDTLCVVDRENKGVEFFYRLEVCSEYGSLFLEEQELKEGSTFFQSDLNEGKVSYQNDGQGGKWDQFVFAVVEKEKNTLVGSSPLKIKIVQDNTAPVVVHHTDLFVPVQSKAVISSDLLSASDQEQDHEHLFYMLMEETKLGSLVHEEKGRLSQGRHFTQADVDAGKLTY